MHAELPRLKLLFSRSSHLAALNASQKLPRQLAFAGMILPVYRAEIEKLVAQRIPFALLREDIRKREGELAKSLRFGPDLFVVERGV
jgi:hypothetical protein